MRGAVHLVVLGIALAASQGGAATTAWRTATVGGIEYVDFAQWAAAQDLRIVRPTPRDWWLTNRWLQLQYTEDSARSSLNGVTVWHAYPFRVLNGVPLV